MLFPSNSSGCKVRLMSLYSPLSDPKYQSADVPGAASAGVIISSDTQRQDRLPPGQTRTRKWPVLHASSVPTVEPAAWTFSLAGLVESPMSWSIDEFRQLPRVKVFADFHCVTTWSRLSNLWEGVLLAPLLEAVGIRPEARFAVIGGLDNGWTTNLPLAQLLECDVLLADTHDGLLLDADHGGPVRLIVPRLFAWKSAKWVHKIELTADNRPGYWEQAGYHNIGDPWAGQRYRDDPEWANAHSDDSASEAEG